MTTTDEDNTSSNHKPKRRPRILLGITGSVAAIKGPEIVVRLVKELQVNVRILLTQGGHNFWNKAEDYNPRVWKELDDLLLRSDLNGGNFDDDSGELQVFVHRK